MVGTLLIIATLCYAAGTVGYLIYLARDRVEIHQAARLALVAGAILHGAAILARSLGDGQIAAGSGQEALSLFAWVIVVAYLLMQARLNLRVFGSFVSPLAVLFMLASRLLPTEVMTQTALLKNAWVVVHITSLFLANALFALACAASIMFLLQERHIKRKNFGFLYPRLPSLESLDGINHLCLIIGFPLMSLGLVAGFIYAGAVWHSAWNWDPKEVAAMITWLIYAVLVHERLAVGWRGSRAAWLSIFGFSAVLITFLGVNLLMEGHHAQFVGQ